MEVKIRKVEIEDASRLAEILRSFGWFAAFENEDAETSVERVRRHLSLCLADDSHSMYVAEVDGRVLGYTSVHWLPYLLLAGPEGYVSELFVQQEGRSQGLGTRLLEAIKQEARQRGCVRLMLLNNRGRESYQRQFYAKNGWQERPEMANFIYRLEGRSPLDVPGIDADIPAEDIVSIVREGRERSYNSGQ